MVTPGRLIPLRSLMTPPLITSHLTATPSLYSARAKRLFRRREERDRRSSHPRCKVRVAGRRHLSRAFYRFGGDGENSTIFQLLRTIFETYQA